MHGVGLNVFQRMVESLGIQHQVHVVKEQVKLIPMTNLIEGIPRSEFPNRQVPESRRKRYLSHGHVLTPGALVYHSFSVI